MFYGLIKTIAAPFSEGSTERDEEAKHQAKIRVLYSKYSDELFHYALSLSDEQNAQDLSQSLWLKLLDRPLLIKERKNIRAYLYTAIRHMVIDEFRRSNRLQYLDEEMLQLSEELDLHTENKQEKFDQALLALPFYQREAFCLQMEGFSLEDISEICNTPKETVKTRLRYARKSLKSYLFSDLSNIGNKGGK